MEFVKGGLRNAREKMWCKAFVGNVLESMIAVPILKHHVPFFRMP
ncbi:hypothetical protein [Muricomes intestini]|nr:hypothetical protein [Muricomes intestini]